MLLSHSTHDLDASSSRFTLPQAPQTQLEHYLDRFERFFVVLAIIYQSSCLYALLSWNFNSLDPMMTRTDAPTEANSPLGGLMRYFVLFCFAILLTVRWRSVWEAAKRRKALWLLLGWLLISCRWSMNPNSQKLANDVIINSIMGLYMASRFTLREIMPMAALGFGITIGMNFLFCLAFPQFGIQVGLQEGSWRGMLVQKNSLARLVVFAAIPFLCFVFSGIKQHRLWYWIGLVICSIIIVLSNSKTGLLIFLMMKVLIPVFQKMRSRSYYALPMFIAVLLLASMTTLLLVGNYEAILTGLGRDPSLSGRTEIWEAMGEKIMQRPLTGYGYAGFWMAREGESIDIWYRSKDLPPHGHNGYLNLSLDLGLVGLVFFGMSFLKACQRSFLWLRWTPGPEGIMPLLAMCEIFVYNITEESLIADANFNVFWMFYVYLTTAILLHPVQANEGLEERIDDTDHNWESDIDFQPIPALGSEAEKP